MKLRTGEPFSRSWPVSDTQHPPTDHHEPTDRSESRAESCQTPQTSLRTDARRKRTTSPSRRFPSLRGRRIHSSSAGTRLFTSHNPRSRPAPSDARRRRIPQSQIGANDLGTPNWGSPVLEQLPSSQRSSVRERRSEGVPLVQIKQRVERHTSLQDFGMLRVDQPREIAWRDRGGS
jgi:hypothetical protein